MAGFKIFAAIIPIAALEVESVPGLDAHQKELLIIDESTIGDIFKTYTKRMTVVMEKEDYKYVSSDKKPQEYQDLLICSKHFYDQYTDRKDRIPICLLNSGDEAMVEDAEMYLNCTTRPCFSVEIEETEGEGGSKAFTKSIGFESGKAKGFSFLDACKAFVKEYTEGVRKGTLQYFTPPIDEEMPDVSDDSDEDMDEEDEV